jgi:cell division protein ZapA
MKQLEVTIMGQSYILGCPDGRETALLEAVGQVDREMCSIRDAGKVKARERIAVLAALNLAYALAERSDGAAPDARLVSGAPETPPAPAHSIDIDALVRRIDSTLGADDPAL